MAGEVSSLTGNDLFPGGVPNCWEVQGKHAVQINLRGNLRLNNDYFECYTQYTDEQDKTPVNNYWELHRPVRLYSVGWPLLCDNLWAEVGWGVVRYGEMNY